jgi:hypothetical protein
MKKHITFALSMMMTATALAAGGDGPGNSIEKKSLAKIQTQLLEAVRNAKAQVLLPYEVTDYVRSGNTGLTDKQQYARDYNSPIKSATGGTTSLLLMGGFRDHEFAYGRDGSITVSIATAIQQRKIDISTALYLRDNWVKPVLRDREATLAKNFHIADPEGLKGDIAQLKRTSDSLDAYVQSESRKESDSISVVKRIVNPKKESNSNARVQKFLEQNLIAGDEKSSLVEKLLNSSYKINDKTPNSAQADSLNIYKEFALPMLQIGLAASDYADFRESYGKIPYLDSNPYLTFPTDQVEMESRMYAIGAKLSKNSQFLAMIMREPLITAAVGYGEYSRFVNSLSDAEKKQVADFKLKNPEVSKLLNEMVEAGIKWNLLADGKGSFSASYSFDVVRRANENGLLATKETPNYEQNFKLNSNMCIKGLR